MDYTHEIVRIERGATKNSGSPMYKCTTGDGQVVNVFQHELPERNTFDLMLQAGYARFSLMALGDVQRWTAHPIRVQLIKDGAWWKLAAVEPRAKDAEADADALPDVEFCRDRAQRLANMLLRPSYGIRYWDCERTGLNDDDELVSVAVVDMLGEVKFATLIRCAHPDKLLRPGKYGKTASDVNGLTPDMLTRGLPPVEALDRLAMHLNGASWVGYNIDFDVKALDADCAAYHLPFIVPFSTHDVMSIFAEYLGDWKPTQQRFRRVSLGEAARLLGIDPGEQHTASADALTTLALVKAMAEGQPVIGGA